MPHSIAITII